LGWSALPTSPPLASCPLARLEAFSDGVFAIAITLLVLELGVSSDADEHLLRSILHEWPSYLAYVTSFLTITRDLAAAFGDHGRPAHRGRDAVAAQPAGAPARFVSALPDEARL
jgi:hypothetical protein